MVELIGVEELAGLLEVEKLVELIKLIDDRVGRARGEKNTSITTTKTRVKESGIVETKIAGIVEATREESQGRLTRNMVRSLSI